MKKVYAHASADGCIESFLDFAKARAAMQAAGFELTDSVEDADVVMVNSCVVGQVVEDRCAASVEELKKRLKPGAELVVTGCMPAYNKARLDALGVDLSFSPRKPRPFMERYELAPFPELGELDREYMGGYNLMNWVAPLLHKVSAAGIPLPAHLFRRFSLVEGEDMFFLRINRGCREACTYCATRFTVGKLVSSSPDTILCRFDKALAEGKRNFALCGEETAAYGLDIGTDFPSLLTAMLARKKDFVISIRQHHPAYIIEKVEEYCRVLADPRVKSFTIPLQSGSDRILELMQRRHTAAAAREMILALHRAAPHVMLRTHMIAGFPTETGEEFDLTVELVRALPWDMVLVYPFTDRPGTKASKLEPKISKRVIDWRMGKIYALILKKLYLNDFWPFPLVTRDPMAVPKIYE